MQRRKTRKRKRQKKFNASITALMPKTLSRSPKKRRTSTHSAHKRKSNFFSILHSRRWRSSHYVALLLAIIGAIALEVGLLDTTFEIIDPVIKNNQYTDTRQIIKEAHLTQHNIFTTNPDETSRRLVAFIPQIKQANVSLGLPNKAIVTITEREPLVVYNFHGHNSWIDADGRIFPAAEQRPDLIHLIDEDGAASQDGQHINVDLIRSLTELSPSLGDIKEFHFQAAYGLFFISEEGWRVYLGNTENLPNKLARWKSIHQQLIDEKRPVNVIDLRFQHVYIQ